MADLRHLGCWCQNAKTWFYGKLMNLVSCNWAIQRTDYWIPKIQDGWDPPSWKSTWRHFFCRGWSDLDKMSATCAEWHIDCSDVVEMIKWKPDVEFQYGGRLGEFNGMSSQSHLPHCRLLPPGEFDVVIPELRFTLQGAATWWIYCRDSRATCHIAGCSHLAKSTSWSCHMTGCNNSIRHIENRFSPYFFVFNAV